MSIDAAVIINYQQTKHCFADCKSWKLTLKFLETKNFITIKNKKFGQVLPFKYR